MHRSEFDTAGFSILTWQPSIAPNTVLNPAILWKPTIMSVTSSGLTRNLMKFYAHKCFELRNEWRDNTRPAKPRIITNDSFKRATSVKPFAVIANYNEAFNDWLLLVGRFMSSTKIFKSSERVFWDSKSMQELRWIIFAAIPNSQNTSLPRPFFDIVVPLLLRDLKNMQNVSDSF